jgi:Asparagine synthase (glutamine-hydrolyzing)
MQSLFFPVIDKIKNLDSYEIFKNVFLQDKNNVIKNQKDYINKIFYFEAKTFLHGLFVVEDKLSMANSLETRVPFMDNDLVDFAMTCPLSLKLNKMKEKIQVNENNLLNKQFIKTNHGKKILREILKNKLPPEIVTMTKQGFSAPDASWFKGESIDFVKDKLYDNNASIYNYLDKTQIQKMLDQHIREKKIKGY